MQIQGSRVLLTGASGGLGQEIARALAAQGAHLTLTARRAEVLEALAAEVGGETIAIDLSEREQVARLADQAGRVDILVANAALPGAGPLDSFTPTEIDRALDVNLRAPIILAHALAPAMAERGGGHLVFVSSLSGKTATKGQTIYSGTKFGLRGFALALRDELRSSGVGVSGIYPGFIREAGMFADRAQSFPPAWAPVRPRTSPRRSCERSPRTGPRSMSRRSPYAPARPSAACPETAARVARLLGGDKVAMRSSPSANAAERRARILVRRLRAS